MDGGTTYKSYSVSPSTRDAHSVFLPDYEYKLDENGEVYICPTVDSQPSIINSAQTATDLIVDASNIGRLRQMHIVLISLL